MTFYAGQSVRCVHAIGSYLEKGAVYTVNRFSEEDEENDEAAYLTLREIKGAFDPVRFEPA